MSTLFADTFYWIALTIPLDEAHQRTKTFNDDIITSQEVLSEFLNFFSSRPERLRRTAARSVNAVLQDLTVRIIPQSDSSFHAGLDLFHARPARATV